MIRLKAVMVAGIVSVFGLATAQAASASTTRIVGTCSGATYTTVQSAVSAANPGDTIQLCAGTFAEQVTDTTNLTFTGAGAASIIQAPATLNDSTCEPGNTAIVDICGGANVTVTNIVVAGPGPSGCGSLSYGIFVTGNATLNISNATVAHIRDNPASGCQNGVGIRAGTASPASVGHLTTFNVTVSDYQKGGIVVSSIGSTSTVNDSTIVGLGATPLIASNGVQISSGAVATVSNNSISGNECNDLAAPCGADPIADTQATGVLIFDAGPGTSVTSNTIKTNDIGVYNLLDDATYGPGTTTVSGNFMSGNRYESLVEDQGHGAFVGNNISGSSTAAVLVISYNGNTQDSVATVTHNVVSGNGVAVLNETDGLSTHTSTASGATNTFAGNTQGLVNKTENVLNFSKNWWGAAMGPSDWGIGTGDTVSDDVTFFPWSTNPGSTTFAACTITGPKKGNATLNGTKGNDIICARGSNNVLVGKAGIDLLIGSTGGHDTLVAGSGPTTMIGQGPNDVLVGGAGRDSMEAPAPATCTGGGPGTQTDCTNP